MTGALTEQLNRPTWLRRSQTWRAALLGVAVLLTAFTLALARSHVTGSFAGASPARSAIEAAAALSLVGVGLLSWRGARANAGLLVAAAFAWLLPEWTNPEAGSALLFTVGLAGFSAASALVVHLALVYPDGGARPGARFAITLSYLGALVALGVLPLLVYDARAQGCLECPRNLLLVHNDEAFYLQLGRWGIRFAIVAFAVAAVTIAVRAARGSRARLAAAGPLMLVSLVYLAAVEVDLWHSVGRGVLSNDPTDLMAWRAEGICLLLISGTVLWGILRARRVRRAMAALVVELARAPRSGAVRDMLATALGDPSLTLAYPTPTHDEYVDGVGEPASFGPAPGRALTRIERDGDEVAVMEHDLELLVVPSTVEEAIAAARLAVDHERLQAQLLAQARELRESRRRIVSEGDGERRRLERDLHDGAQQRLVGLSLALRLLATRAPSELTHQAVTEADATLRDALADLREVAHGIYPAALHSEGLAAALDDLVEHVPGPVRITGAPPARLSAAIEEAAYFTAAEILRDVAEHAAAATVSATVLGADLALDIERRGPVDELDKRLVEIADRVGALGGRVETEHVPGVLRLRARVPCES
jgi:signal transduction histidine kinase